MEVITGDTPSSKRRRRGLNLFFAVAFGAIFLLGVAGIREKNQSLDQDKLLANTSGAFLSGNSQAASPRAFVPEAPELIFVEKNGILASTPPVTVTPKVLGAILGEAEADIRPEIIRYIVKEGDTPLSLAGKFGISLETILWANDLSENSPLVPGKELIILPVSGALHLVREHDTLSEIASWYKADLEEIVSFNRLSSVDEIFVGDILIIPGGVKPRTIPAGRLTPVADSYFIYPIPSPYHITQGLHPFNAVDFDGDCGDPVYAAAGGLIQRTGYTKIGGNYVRVLHPNGVVTYYGHLSSIAVAPGTKVFQGQIIGYVGYSGRTIPPGPAGCHLHFEVRGASNPFGK